MTNSYRKRVVLIILNQNNEILVGRRIDNPSGFWQMPQGGIDKNEIPEQAVWREMMEEIGTNSAKLIHTSSQWLKYDIPKEILKGLPWGEEYIGQEQKWFMFRFVGQENEINVSTDNPEFSEWKWIDHKLILENIVPFKKNIYQNVLKEFNFFFKD